MPRPRFDKLTDDKRIQLLESAAVEFAVHGYLEASLNRILSRAGLSKGAFYYYFDDKADLFETFVDFAWAQVTGGRRFDPAELTADGFWRQVEEWSDFLRDRGRDNPWLAGIGKLIYDPPAEDGIAELVAERAEQVHGWLGELLARGRQLEVLRDDQPQDLQLRMVVGALEGADRWFVENYDSLSEEAEAEASRSVFAALRRLMSAREPSPLAREGEEP